MENRINKVRYTIDLLTEYIKQEDAVLLGNYNKLNRETTIKFKCKCGNLSSKKFRLIVEQRGAICKECGEKIRQETKFQTNINKYGTKVALNNPEIKMKALNTLNKNYGVHNPSQNKYIQQKKIETSIKKYGVSHPSQTNSFQEKRKKGCRKNLGVDFPTQNHEVLKKIREKNLQKFGVENPSQNEEIKIKKKLTCNKNHGVDYATQSIEIMDKIQNSSLKFKEYTMPSGKIRKIQGYEHFAIDKLLKENNEENIITSRRDIPKIQYFFENKEHYHFPDIYINSTNTLIEVKSAWTYYIETEKIHEKYESAKLQGYNYEIWIFNSKGEIVEKYI